MGASLYESVDAYVRSHPKGVQSALNQVRAALRKAVPEATEVMSYSIGASRLPEGVVLYFAGWTKHYSLYPATETLRIALGKALAKHWVRQGTIKFSLSEPVPVKLIERIAKLRAKEVRARSVGEGSALTKRVRAAARKLAAKRDAKASATGSAVKRGAKSAATGSAVKRGREKPAAIGSPVKHGEQAAAIGSAAKHGEQAAAIGSAAKRGERLAVTGSVKRGAKAVATRTAAKPEAPARKKAVAARRGESFVQRP